MPLDPGLAEVLTDWLRGELADVHTAIPGKIKTYDATTQTAEVIVQVRAQTPKEDGSLQAEEPPVIPNVPVQWPRGGGYALHFPLTEGDFVLLVFSEAAIGHWRETGQLADPGDLERHSLSYPFAIPGVAPNAGKLLGTSSSEARLIVGTGGAIAVGDAAGVAAAQPVMVADAFMLALQAGSTAAGAAAVAVGAGGAAAAFTAFVGAFSASLVSSSKLKAQFP